MLKAQLVLKLSNMRAYFEQPILRDVNKNSKSGSGDMQALPTEIQKQSVQAQLHAKVEETYLNPHIQKSRYIFLCPKMLMWESQIDDHKRHCCIIQGAENVHEDVALLEFDQETMNGLACFICGAQRDELPKILYHYITEHRDEFWFQVTFFEPKQGHGVGTKRNHSSYRQEYLELNNVAVIHAYRANQNNYLEVLQCLKVLEVLSTEADFGAIFKHILPIVNGFGNFLSSQNGSNNTQIQKIMTKYMDLRVKPKLLNEQRLMSVKYSKLPLHVQDHYHDPQTGLLKFKDNFEQDQVIERQRDKKLMRDITLHKIDNVDVELDAECHAELKNFMALWNKIYFYFESGCKDTVDSSSSDMNDSNGILDENGQHQAFKVKTDVEKTVTVIDEMLPEYSLYTKKRLKERGMEQATSKNKIGAAQYIQERNKAIKVYEDIFLSHLMNLFNAGLIEPNKMNEYINKFRGELEY